MLEFVVNALFLLLLGCIAAWLILYRRFNSADPTSSHYRWHQVLVALIALLAILVAVVVVLSSDPGNPDDYIFLP